MDEREAIVAWLRREVQRPIPDGPDWRCPHVPTGSHAVGQGPGLMLALADMIERGVHLREPASHTDDGGPRG